MPTFSQLIDHYRRRDEILASSIDLLRHNYGAEVQQYAEEILLFVSHAHGDAALVDYERAHADLMRMADTFARTGRYEASAYSDVRPIGRDLYNIRLLLSYITTNHRFEILRMLTQFLQAPCNGPTNLLLIGVGTGYELKMAYDNLPLPDDWSICAVDTCIETLKYARRLLEFFEYPVRALCDQEFPLESKSGVGPYADQFGKIVVCEVLEHLEGTDQALANLRHALHPKGQMLLTMAINMPQEDHIHLYRSVQQARSQVRLHGLLPVRELACPATIFPFREEDRESLACGNYVCVVGK
jgi:SAM-dependent methyltransferase